MGDVEISSGRATSPIVLVSTETTESPALQETCPSKTAELDRLGSAEELQSGAVLETQDTMEVSEDGGFAHPAGSDCYDQEMLDSMHQFSESMMLSCGFPPRTIPFRSASFSQVDVTSEGKYIRNIRSPITLKPTAFCLNKSGPLQDGASNEANSSTCIYNNNGGLESPEIHLPDIGTESEPGCGRSDHSTANMFFENIISLPTEPSDVDTKVTQLVTQPESCNEFPSCRDNSYQRYEKGTEVGNDLAIRVNDFEEGESDTFREGRVVSFTLGGDDEPLTMSKPSSPTPVPTNENETALRSILEMSLASKDESMLSQEPGTDKSTQSDPKPDDEYNLSSILMMGQYSNAQNSGAPGAGSTTSTSGGEADDDAEKNHLLRQSSGQSDGSDELPNMTALSDTSCSSPPPGTLEDSAGHPIGATSLDSSSGESSGTGKISTSAPTSSTVNSPPLANSPPTLPVNKKEMSRAHSINSGSLSSTKSLPRGRYYKRPLRGPYGEMLEAEMNKLVRPSKEFENLEFLRESKSSSPIRPSPIGQALELSNKGDSEGDRGSSSDKGNTLELNPSSTTKLVTINPLLMASMDDLNLTKQSKHSTNPRSRKISANLPVHGNNYSDNAMPLAFHQRTASSPSQLLYTTTTSIMAPSAPTPKQNEGRREETPGRSLDGSPRGHVLAEIVETEKSYVDSLRILVKKYMEPLKSSDFIDAGLVDEIFFQVPTILWHHERLLDALQKRVIDDMQCVGDVLLDAFRQNSLLECYSLFVNNWKNAKGSLKMAVASKPSLARFLESNARQHKGKLNLDSLLIMPIQRIPRFELLVKELIKYTAPVHEDHSRLILVLDKIKKFALHIDCASVDPNDNREIEIEGWASGLGHLVRQDILLVCINNSNVRKERALFLFADSLVVASIKRKSTRKPSSNSSYQFGSTWDGCKFKLLIKVQLTEIKLLNEEMKSDAVGASGCDAIPGTSGAGVPEEVDDLKTITRMMDLAATLKCSHAGLDDILKEMAITTKHQADSGEVLELEFKSTEGSECPDVLKLLFGSAEKKNAWLESFHDTLGKFVRYGFGKLPQVQFQQALPIRKTRAGLQLSCASPVSLHHKVSKCELNDVWVANSDGYVGQVCILTLHPEPSITSCNGVCNSRITCILAVPPPFYGPIEPAPARQNNQHSPHPEDPHHPENAHESEDDHKHGRAGAHKEHWSVWLGTEDGGLHIYDCADSVRVKKNRQKVTHKTPLISIVFFDDRVFASLGSGDVAVYSRNKHSKGWALGEASWVTIGSAMTPVTKMLCVGTQIWCACGSQIKVYGDNAGMLELVQSVQVTIDGNQMPRAITSMVTTDEFVWLAVHGSSVIKCYNFNTFECVFETNVAPEVSKILAGSDDIIRQHKSACLRVTALLISPNKTLWIGTSAGVILTLSPANSSECKIVPLCHGHTGQVRFLTYCMNRDVCNVISGGDGYEEFRPVTPTFNNNSSSFSSMVTSFIGESFGDPSGREDSTNHLLIWKTPKPT